jgi:hypothetical protein
MSQHVTADSYLFIKHYRLPASGLDKSDFTFIPAQRFSSSVPASALSLADHVGSLPSLLYRITTIDTKVPTCLHISHRMGIWDFKSEAIVYSPPPNSLSLYPHPLLIVASIQYHFFLSFLSFLLPPSISLYLSLSLSLSVVAAVFHQTRNRFPTPPQRQHHIAPSSSPSLHSCQTHPPLSLSLPPSPSQKRAYLALLLATSGRIAPLRATQLSSVYPALTADFNQPRVRLLATREFQAP